MGETVLVRALTPDMIAGGEALLRRLDEENLQIVAAFWLYREVSCEWVLMLATPRSNDTDSRLLYRRARLILEELGENRVTLNHLMFAGPSHWDVKYYGRQVWRGRLPKNMIRHIDCGNYFIYRFLPLRSR